MRKIQPLKPRKQPDPLVGLAAARAELARRNDRLLASERRLAAYLQAKGLQ